jgi:hypothetical protein
MLAPTRAAARVGHVTDTDIAHDFAAASADVQAWLLRSARRVPEGQQLAVPPSIADGIPPSWLETTSIWWFPDAGDPVLVRTAKPEVMAFLLAL